jgi:hypothetical protein
MDNSKIVKPKIICFNESEAVCGEMYCGEKQNCEKNVYLNNYSQQQPF